MNLASHAPQWALILLLLLLTAAAVEDAVRLRISNLTSIAVLLLAFAVMVIAGPQIDLWENFVVFAVTLAIGTLLFGMGKLGGGDVKLLAAMALWFDLGGALRYVVAVTIAGGILALVILVLRLVGWSDKARKRVVILKRRGGIPYGVAIAVGAALTVLTAPPAQERADPLRNWTLPQAR